MRQFQYLSLQDIDSNDRLFEVNYGADLTALTESIKRMGILQPLRVIKKESVVQIVSGFRRHDSALALGLSQVPVLEQEALNDPLSLFKSALEENFFNRELNTLEKSIALKKLEHQFGVSRERVVETYMPFLGLEPSERLLRFYQGAMRLEERLKHYLINQKFPIHIVEDFMRFSSEDQRVLIPFLETFHFTVSSLKEFLVWSHEIVLRDHIALRTFLYEPIFQELLQSREDRHQGVKKFRRQLKLRRYPKLMELETEFAALKKKLGLPFEPPNFFEDNRVQLRVSFRDKKELKGWVEKMNGALTQKELEEMINIL